MSTKVTVKTVVLNLAICQKSWNSFVNDISNSSSCFSLPLKKGIYGSSRLHALEYVEACLFFFWQVCLCYGCTKRQLLGEILWEDLDQK